MLQNFLYTKFDKDGNILIMFPDGTGNVYLATKDIPLYEWGHYLTCIEKIASLGYEPIGRLVRDEKQRLHYSTNAGSSTEEKATIISKCEKLLGIDWEVPLNQQKQKIINRALFYIGMEKTVEMAYELIQRSERFVNKETVIKNAGSYTLPKPENKNNSKV